MGHRSYLYSIKEEKRELLFEANNALPFFWLGLLDRHILEDCKDRWIAYEEACTEKEEIDEADLPRTELVIGRDVLETNLESLNRFLDNHFQNALPLFIDFRNYLSRQLQTPEYTLGLELIALTNFSSVAEFWADLDRQVRQIKENRADQIRDVFFGDLIGNGTGFSCAREPLDTPAYRQAIQEREKAAKPYLRSKKRFNIINLMLYVATLMLCPFFTYMAYKSVVQDGWDFKPVVIIFCNFLFYLFSIYGIVSEIKAWRN